MKDDFDEIWEPAMTAGEEALLQEMPTLTGVGQTRRAFTVARDVFEKKK